MTSSRRCMRITCAPSSLDRDLTTAQLQQLEEVEEEEEEEKSEARMSQKWANSL